MIPEKIFMCGSSHIQSVLIGVEYQNCCRNLDVYLLVAISMGQIQSKQIYKLVTYCVGIKIYADSGQPLDLA